MLATLDTKRVPRRPVQPSASGLNSLRPPKATANHEFGSVAYYGRKSDLAGEREKKHGKERMPTSSFPPPLPLPTSEPPVGASLSINQTHVSALVKTTGPARHQRDQEQLVTSRMADKPVETTQATKKGTAKVSAPDKGIQCRCRSIRTYKCPDTCTTVAAVSVPAILIGRRILVIGDSLPWTLSQTLRCVVGQKMHIQFHAMHVFPLDELAFEATLSAWINAQQYAAVVFGIGTWYNWQWGAQLSEHVNASTATRILNEQCPATLRLDLNADPYNRRSSDGDWVWRRAERIRSRCKALLGQSSYASGLMQLRNIVSRNANRWPPVVWKDVPPQHWSTVSGQFDYAGGSMNLSKCVPWRNATLAYDRNRLADQILRDDNVPISFVRTWDYDAHQWMQHVPYDAHRMDCTHYCNPSNVTGNWAKATLGVVAGLTSTVRNRIIGK
eukprot:COSAG01_NODE_2468_length_7634_cov_6.744127_2_plen_443_part_00